MCSIIHLFKLILLLNYLFACIQMNYTALVFILSIFILLTFYCIIPIYSFSQILWFFFNHTVFVFSEDVLILFHFIICFNFQKIFIHHLYYCTVFYNFFQFVHKTSGLKLQSISLRVYWEISLHLHTSIYGLVKVGFAKITYFGPTSAEKNFFVKSLFTP